MIYKPFINLIILLLSTPNFEKILNYKNIKRNKYDNNDILDGISATRNKMEMNINFNSISNKEKFIPINLLCAIFYDGMQIYKTSVTSFWPLFLTILNLPPSFRSTNHAGVFISSIFTSKYSIYFHHNYINYFHNVAVGKHQSQAEEFLFNECLLHEFILLYHGIYINIKDKKYFVQARIISHVFDTKGAEKALNMTVTSQSKFGSPLVKNGIKGVYFDEYINKTSFCDDYRIYIDLKHKSRMAGQSGKCCPIIEPTSTIKEMWYINNTNNNINVIAEEANNNINVVIAEEANELQLIHIDSLCIVNDLKNNKIFQDFHQELKIRMESKKSKQPDNFFIWHHYCHDPDDTMCSKLFFPHCCYKFSKYERINKIDFEESINSKKNGFKGESFFSKLPYSDIQTDFCWDVMHVIKNLSLHLIGIISGNNCHNKPNIKLFCKELGCHPYFYKENGTEPWKISESNQKKIDTFISCIRIPTSYDFQVKMIFHPSGTLDCDDHQRIILCLLNLIGFIGKLPYQYQEYLSMLQFDYNEIMRHSFSKEYDYDLLFNLVVETGICKQGLFPYSELYFDGLQTIDLPYSIRDIGPVRSYNSYTGERFNKDVKNHTKIGGNNSELTTFNCIAEVSDLRSR
jgi:hypothetical protein